MCVFVVHKLEHFFGGKFLQLSFDSNESFIYVFEASFMLSGATFVVQLQKYSKVHFRLYMYTVAILPQRILFVMPSYFTVWRKSDGQKTCALASE